MIRRIILRRSHSADENGGTHPSFHHLHTEGPDVPPGEVYFSAENPKGELGFYINFTRGRDALPAEDPGGVASSI